MLARGFGFWMWRRTLGSGVRNVRGLAGNLSNVTVASSQYDILYRALRLWSQKYVMCRSCWFPDSRIVLGQDAWSPRDGCICTRWQWSISPTQILVWLLHSASFLFVSDFNGHHQEWLGSTTTNSLRVAAFDFATVSGCDQLV